MATPEKNAPPTSSISPSLSTSPQQQQQQPQTSPNPNRVAGKNPPPSLSSAQPSQRDLSKRKPADTAHRNVHLTQKDQAIWDPFRARTAPGCKIFIGRNTTIAPGVQIFAEKGDIIIGENNIICEGATIMNRGQGEMKIGVGNVFECGCRIEASVINDYNVFGAKCHIMQDAVIGSGCVICPRVMVIQKKHIKDCMVVFGDNMMHEQNLMKKRNRAYIEQMLVVLRGKFKESKESNNASSSEHGGHDGSSRVTLPPLSQGQTSTSSTTSTTSTTSSLPASSRLPPNASNRVTVATTASPLNYGTKSREEKALSGNPNITPNAPKQ